MKNIKSAFSKLKQWFDAFEGNEEEAGVAYITKKVAAVMDDPENNDVTEMNVLMFKYVFISAKGEDDSPLFNLYELMIIYLSLTERDGFYQLETDVEFCQRIFGIGEYDQEQLDLMFAEVKHRLEIRVHLSSLIMMEEKRRG